MARTKKVGIAGKYGPRYGRTIRNRVVSVSKTQKASHRCSECLRFTVRRVSAGIWACGKCGHKFAGKAYKPAA